MKTDYPELEGKEIVYIYKHINNRGIVAGVNFDVGISIDSLDSPGEHLVCLHGPSFKGHTNYVSKSYKTEFFSTVAMIKKGHIDGAKIAKFELLKSGTNHDNPLGSVGVCSYIG